MASYTQHYQLHQWEPDDNFLRTDFNEDLEKIDTALGKKSEMVMGCYTGDGAETRKISLSFTPKVVILATNEGETFRYPTTSGGIAVEDHPVVCYNEGLPCVEIVEGGFQVGYNSKQYVETNGDGTVYHYTAFR